MLIASIVLMACFAVASAVHLYFCYIENEKARKISKPFTLVFLTPAIFLLVPAYPFIWLFPLLSLIGDIMLIWKKKHKAFFILGFAFFFLAHISNLVQLTFFLLKSDSNIPVIAYIVFAICLAVIIYFVFPITKKFVGNIAILGNVYMPTLLFVGCFSLLVTAAYADSYQGLLVALGYIFFIFSDGFLIYSNFIKDIKRNDFYIMATYLIAEALITMGLSMLVVSGVVA